MQPTTEEYAHLESGVDICLDTFGNRSDPPLLLIMGLGGPLTWWHSDLCGLLASRGFFVIRFDNRDVGRSTILRGVGGRRGDVIRTFFRSRTKPPYSMSDMAADAVGVLDYLELDTAHVTGASMGGMIAQTMAIEHPDRVRSLVSIMSTTGRRSVGWQDPRLLPMLLGGNRTDRDRVIAQSVRTWTLIGSPGYPTPDDDIRERAAETFDRGISMQGVIRQMQAVLAQPDRTLALRAIDMPVLVIHGLQDRMVHVSGGRATAHAVAGSELLLVPGMGHDMPRQLWPTIADGIERTAQRSEIHSSR